MRQLAKEAREQRAGIRRATNQQSAAEEKEAKQRDELRYVSCSGFSSSHFPLLVYCTVRSPICAMEASPSNSTPKLGKPQIRKW